MTSYFRAMRLERWPRSLAIFAGSAAFFLLNRDSIEAASFLWIVSRSAFIFLLTWAISTANYVINEIADAPYDIHHPTKKNRPLIKGEIHQGPFSILGIALALSSLAVAFFLFSRPFFFSLLTLLIAGFIYNIKPVRTKDIPFLDSISESANNPIRFLIGWFAFSLPDQFPPLALLLCWWSFGNFLMVAKRLSEFRFLRSKAGSYRSSLKRYSKRSLLLGLAASTLVFFTTYFIFAVTFKLQSFVYLSPLVFFYFFLFFRKTLQEHEVMEEPEKLLTRPLYALYTLFLVITFFLSFLLDKTGQ
jgi:4-hydroxybenzoate polyprenyltransferase